MAWIDGMIENNQRIVPQKAEKSVDCGYQVIEDEDGRRIIHLTTHGSKHRASPPKSSQSMQFGQTVAETLVDILCEAFDLSHPSGSGVEPEVRAAYQANPHLFRELIAADVEAADVVGLARRRAQVDRFRKLLTDDVAFRAEMDALPGSGKEKVWQQFFEQNPWILGTSLATQLLTSWNDKLLEQVVAGYSIVDVGKRTDALLRTSGRIRSMAFVEFKTHTTDLLAPKPYRSGVWKPSSELTGAVAQAQVTAHRASREIQERLQSKDVDGGDIPGDWTYMFRPKSYVVVGQLGQFVVDSGGHHEQKIRSFELYRRELSTPEVVTFDELLAKAEWMVATPPSE
ncbi:Shedu immune nuclease family protein [Nocardia sp. NPDC058666]|uniref:Shedu immune nuclease family protein n=1 Tax=Nocardia sp. NPDC058666 TaxID=3346587 RepID=UPI003655C128